MDNKQSKKEYYGIVSFELAMKLQSAGFKVQTNIFYNVVQQWTYYKDERVCDAPYLHEMLEVLPPPQNGDTFLLGLCEQPTDKRYFCNVSMGKVFRSDNPANALAEAILFTLKNNRDESKF